MGCARTRQPPPACNIARQGDRASKKEGVKLLRKVITGMQILASVALLILAIALVAAIVRIMLSAIASSFEVH
jgi:hypothetical protein